MYTSGERLAEQTVVACQTRVATRVIGELTGKRFIFGGKVRNIKATVFSPQKVTVAEAYQAFLAVLAANHLTVVPRGRFYKIVDAVHVPFITYSNPTTGGPAIRPAELQAISHLSYFRGAKDATPDPNDFLKKKQCLGDRWPLIDRETWRLVTVLLTPLLPRTFAMWAG